MYEIPILYYTIASKLIQGKGVYTPTVWRKQGVWFEMLFEKINVV